MHARVKTPRPQIPDLPSSSESYLSEDSFSYAGKDITSWHVEKTGVKHRSSEVTGWMCVPKSVVMATALNLKHLHRLSRGKPLTILPDPDRLKCRPLSEKTLAYIETQQLNRNQRKVQKKPPNELISSGCYEDFLDENMTDVSSLKERFGAITPERYESVELQETNKKEIWEKYLRSKNETKSLEASLPEWKRSFLPPSTEVQDVIVRVHNAEKKGNRGTRFHSRPLTADYNLRNQSKKASKVRDARPLSACSSKSFRAMKTYEERTENMKKNLDFRRLPGYPPRVIRNRSRKPSPMCNKRPIMTTETAWFPISFHSKLKGKLINFGCDTYGYQTVAEYEELCYSLNDGMAVVEQTLDLGDIFNIKILDTDRRMGLLCVAVRSESSEIGKQSIKGEVIFDEMPKNRIVAKSCKQGAQQWKYSYEIPNLKKGDHLQILRDNAERLKCTVNGDREQLLLYVGNADPVLLAFSLGLGVTKIQLLGCQKKNKDLLNTELETSAIIKQGESPFLLQDSSNNRCSFCEETMRSSRTDLKLPYACDHIAVCENCCNRVECRICDAPLCWSACPLCDNRLQSY